MSSAVCEWLLITTSSFAAHIFRSMPEPKWGWSLGSCDMALYEQYCRRVEVVRTVEQLAHMAEILVSLPTVVH